MFKLHQNIIKQLSVSDHRNPLEPDKALQLFLDARDQLFMIVNCSNKHSTWTNKC